MAHELGHVRNYDIRLSMIVFGLVVAVGLHLRHARAHDLLRTRQQQPEPDRADLRPRRAAHRAARREPRAGRGLAPARVPGGCHGRHDDAASRRPGARPREARGLRAPDAAAELVDGPPVDRRPAEARRHRPPVRHAPADRRARQAPRGDGRRVLRRADASGSGRADPSAADAQPPTSAARTGGGAGRRGRRPRCRRGPATPPPAAAPARAAPRSRPARPARSTPTARAAPPPCGRS